MQKTNKETHRHTEINPQAKELAEVSRLPVLIKKNYFFYFVKDVKKCDKQTNRQTNYSDHRLAFCK